MLKNPEPAALEPHQDHSDGARSAGDGAYRSLLDDSSIELTTNGREAIEAAARHLPSGTRVYVPKMPREALRDKLEQIAILHELGLQPVPHVAARQLASEHELERFLDTASSRFGVRRVLVIGGDQQTSGPYKDSAAVLASGVLAATGIRQVDVAGYPDGHPQIPREALVSDLELKVKLAAKQELELNLVTQFGFDPESIAVWCAGISRIAPGAAVYAGIAGPTSPTRLLRYARICGVSTSIKALNTLGLNAVKLAMHARPERQLAVLAKRRAAQESGGLAGLHLFSFGGFVESAAWLRQQFDSAGAHTR